MAARGVPAQVPPASVTSRVAVLWWWSKALAMTGAGALLGHGTADRVQRVRNETEKYGFVVREIPFNS
jgi:hypothetical protein